MQDAATTLLCIHGMQVRPLEMPVQIVKGKKMNPRPKYFTLTTKPKDFEKQFDLLGSFVKFITWLNTHPSVDFANMPEPPDKPKNASVTAADKIKTLVKTMKQRKVVKIIKFNLDNNNGVIDGIVEVGDYGYAGMQRNRKSHVEKKYTVDDANMRQYYFFLGVQDESREGIFISEKIGVSGPKTVMEQAYKYYLVQQEYHLKMSCITGPHAIVKLMEQDNIIDEVKVQAFSQKKGVENRTLFASLLGVNDAAKKETSVSVSFKKKGGFPELRQAIKDIAKASHQSSKTHTHIDTNSVKNLVRVVGLSGEEPVSITLRDPDTQQKRSYRLDKLHDSSISIDVSDQVDRDPGTGYADYASIRQAALKIYEDHCKMYI